MGYKYNNTLIWGTWSSQASPAQLWPFSTAVINSACLIYTRSEERCFGDAPSESQASAHTSTKVTEQMSLMMP